MRIHSALARALLLARGTLVLQANKRPHIRLPGFRVTPGMKCPTRKCVGRLTLKNGIHQCDRCYAIVDTT